MLAWVQAPTWRWCAPVALRIDLCNLCYLDTINTSPLVGTYVGVMMGHRGNCACLKHVLAKKGKPMRRVTPKAPAHAFELRFKKRHERSAWTISIIG